MRIKTIFTVFLLLFVATAAMSQNVITRKPPKTQTTPAKPAKPSKPSKPKPSSASLCPDNNHPHMIDLGLPSGTKWSCCNVGATKPEAYGKYFAWGETEDKTSYDWDTYKYCNGTSKTCQNIGSKICGTQYDVAHVKWGGSWQMPSGEQVRELDNNCTFLWTTFNGVRGAKFTSKINGKSIFLPAAGRRTEGTVLRHRGTFGYYYGGELSSSETTQGYIFGFDNVWYSSLWHGDGRCEGLSVRPVAK